MAGRIFNWSWNLALAGFVISGLVVLLIMLWISPTSLSPDSDNQKVGLNPSPVSGSQPTGGSGSPRDSMQSDSPNPFRNPSNPSPVPVVPGGPDDRGSDPLERRLRYSAVNDALIALAFIRLGHADRAIEHLNSVTPILGQAQAARYAISEWAAYHSGPDSIPPEGKSQLAAYIAGLPKRLGSELPSPQNSYQLFLQADVAFHFAEVCEDLKIDGAVDFIAVASQLLQLGADVRKTEDEKAEAQTKLDRLKERPLTAGSPSESEDKSKKQNPKTNAAWDFLTKILGSAFVLGILSGFTKPIVDGWSRLTAARLGASSPSGPPKEPSIRVLLEQIISSKETVPPKTDSD